MRTPPSPQTKIAAVFALIIAMGTIVALVTGSAGVADLLLVAMLLAVSLMALSNHRDTRRQSGR